MFFLWVNWPPNFLSTVVILGGQYPLAVEFKRFFLLFRVDLV